MKQRLQGVVLLLLGVTSLSLMAHEATSPIMPVVDLNSGWEIKKKSLSEANELPIWQLPNVDRAVESYFSPDSKQLIFYAKSKASEAYHINIAGIDGRGVHEINDVGTDACSFFFPDNKRVVFTSTKDNLDMPRGNWSKVGDYPQGAELYTADVDGSNVKRLTDNRQYDAEVSVSPDGEWILFTRETSGMLDLWRVRPDGRDEQQITHSPDLQEGGAFYMPDSETIIFRAWLKSEQDKRDHGMDIYTVKHDGTGQKRITNDGGVNWAPFPAPDGKHFAFAKMHPPYNFEIYLMNIETGKQTRLTDSSAFDGFPSISPDGTLLSFSSSRSAEKGSRKLTIFLMNISSLGVGPVVAQQVALRQD